MLVDLGRNDVGRVSVPGSVRIPDLMVVENYSHVMHLVSEVQGELAADKTVYDALRAAFPAGTLSGAPKVRAMQIIDDLEQRRRGIYGGAVGYFGPNGNADFGIAIRTLEAHADKFLIQAGAGIVADSDPEKEADETEHKARAVMRAAKWAASQESAWV
jgi:anthranilate synthase component I